MRHAIRHGIRSTIAVAKSLRPGAEGDPQPRVACAGALLLPVPKRAPKATEQARVSPSAGR
jgi:hypothetical protein